MGSEMCIRDSTSAYLAATHSPTLCSPPARPSPPGPPFSCLLPVPAHEAARWRAPLSRLATSCLVASLLDAPGDATTPLASLSLSLEPLSLSLRPYPPLLSLPPATERSPSPPTSARAAAAILKPLRHALELRRSSLVLLVISRDQKSPGTPPPTFSPSSAAGDLPRRPARSDASPAPSSAPANSP